MLFLELLLIFRKQTRKHCFYTSLEFDNIENVKLFSDFCGTLFVNSEVAPLLLASA